MVSVANRDFELELLKKYKIVAGVDEVGRGCLAGPVYVCISAIDTTVEDCQIQMRDSKLLTEKAREEKFSYIANWVLGYSIGIANNEEIDKFGISKALEIAGHRAINNLKKQGIIPDIYILDGKYDWLTPKVDLFSFADNTINENNTNSEKANLQEKTIENQKQVDGFQNNINIKKDAQIEKIEKSGYYQFCDINVITKIKADRDCTIVSAASILAKVIRDKYMQSLNDVKYDFYHNKGYGSPKHIEGLKKYGLSKLHRKSWKMPI